jgi:Tfp pilus assembly protein PilX
MRAASRTDTPETGGITILVALLLLTAATMAALGVSRTSLRETLITGSESTARKSYEIADSGLDYAITWVGNTQGATSTNNAVRSLSTMYSDLTNQLDSASNSNLAGTGGVYSTTLTAATIGGDFTPGTTGYLQPTQAQPAFDVEVRFLGKVNPFDPTSKTFYYLVRTTGRSNITGTGQSFISVREALIKKSS